MSPRQLSAAITFLKNDAHLAAVIAHASRPKLTAGQDPFEALIRSIVYQQISGKAAASILRKFHGLFRRKNGVPVVTPKTVSRLSETQLRSAGLSTQKVAYVRDLAAKFLDGTVDPSHFDEMTDDAIREHLIRVKGIGRWTADMFLMFTLHRPDVLPTGDLAIQKGFQKVFRMRSLPGVAKMEKLARSWQPYRTVASLYLWKSVDPVEEEGKSEGESAW